MADVLHRQTLELRRSVNTPDFPSEDWVINPDLSAVANVAQRYWKLTGDVVSEMSAEEKSVVDAALAPIPELYPYEFLQLMTPTQVVAIQQSADPTVIVLKSKLQTIVSPMPFNSGSELVNAVGYLAATLPEVFPEAEVARILAMEVPS